MTLPVTLADAPALPRAAEAATAAPPSGEGAAFAETLAETMATPAGGATVAASGAAGEVEAAKAAMDAEAMLADMDERAVGLADGAAPDRASALTDAEGMAVVEDIALAGEASVVDPDPAIAAVVVETAPDQGDAPELAEDGAVEAGGTAAADIPLALPMTALLAAALPPAPAGDSAAPTVQAADATVEAARRAMAATMAMPGQTRADKGVKGPLDGPDAAEPAVEGEVAVAGKDETGQAKTAVAAEVRGVTAPVIPMTVAQRNGVDARREASAEVMLAITGGDATANGTGTTAPASAPQQSTAQAMGHLPTGPIQMTRPGWEVALADRIAAELSSDGKEIELDLAPETLGHLKIRLEVVDGLAQVRIVTETPEAARLFQQNEHRLSENLSRAGLSLGGQDAASRDAQNGGAQGQNGQTPDGRGARMRGMELHFDRHGTGVLAEMAGRAGRGLVNLIA